MTRTDFIDRLFEELVEDYGEEIKADMDDSLSDWEKQERMYEKVSDIIQD